MNALFATTEGDGNPSAAHDDAHLRPGLAPEPVRPPVRGAMARVDGCV
jgi:hypothetical protein